MGKVLILDTEGQTPHRPSSPPFSFVFRSNVAGCDSASPFYEGNYHLGRFPGTGIRDFSLSSSSQVRS